MQRVKTRKVKSGTVFTCLNDLKDFYSIHFTVTLAGLKNIIRHTGDFVIKGFAILGFHCSEVKRSKNLLVIKKKCHSYHERLCSKLLSCI